MSLVFPVLSRLSELVWISAGALCLRIWAEQGWDCVVGCEFTPAVADLAECLVTSVLGRVEHFVQPATSTAS